MTIGISQQGNGATRAEFKVDMSYLDPRDEVWAAWTLGMECELEYKLHGP